MAKQKSLICPDCDGKMKGSDESELMCDSCGKKYGAKDCKMSRDSAKACSKCDNGEIEPEEPEESESGTKMLKCDSCGHKMRAGTKDSVDTVTVQDSMIWSASPTDIETAKGMGFIEPFKAQADGSLRGRTVGTTIGVYTYRMADGTIKRRLRHPSQVFADKSVASLALVPVTNGHPSVLVTPDNYKQYAVGSVGDVVSDAYRLYPKLNIIDKQAIEDIRAGKKFLSCGYTADIVSKSGNYNGSEYDEEQTNIIYNHVALVDKPRAGDEAVMHFDGLDVQHTQEVEMKKIIIDGKEYEADEALAGIVAQFQVDSKESSEKLAKAEGERDMLKSQVEKLQLDAAESAKSVPAQIEGAVKARLALIDAAQKFEVEIKPEQTDREVRVACLAKNAPSLNLDGKDDLYVEAAFDMALATVGTADVGRRQLSEVHVDHDKVEDSAESARLRMIDSLKSLSRG
jgi:hypothetical protein